VLQRELVQRELGRRPGDPIHRGGTAVAERRRTAPPKRARGTGEGEILPPSEQAAGPSPYHSAKLSAKQAPPALTSCSLLCYNRH
jgi:hypothetical protein